MDDQQKACFYTGKKLTLNVQVQREVDMITHIITGLDG